ncbi:hypothetical protein [Xanthomonas translucens]|uniref:hypothetical protein n=1 Tax=Xanthomonas campestris pv. translucens TaxID=343 RepID=UPI00114C98C3|nr:hypothetical protein [Xanthomonas translucens]MCT8270262.1 hypothetical protein [Xanthomonas translucens pv. undulosa]UKE50895.1 hypothetical protein KCU57_00195 [Xanthomonas translucens]WNJ29409.1 hypothetical protein RMA82_11155 [Xanthomonas translucens pv. undulosa]
MNPATIITGALLSQVLLGVLMFVAASIMRAHQSRTAMFRGEPIHAEYTWLILALLLVSVAILILTHSMASLWTGLFQNTSFSGVPDRTATLSVFFINIAITTMLVAGTGGSVDSPFQPIFFLIPTLALLLFEPSFRVVIYAALVSACFTVLLVKAEPIHDAHRRGAKKAYGFVSIASLVIAVIIGLLTRICPDRMC